MFGWLKGRGSEPDTLKKYAESAIKGADAQFAKTWPHDPAWIGLMGVAEDLDKVHETDERVSEIMDKIVDSFSNGRSVQTCSSLLLLVHLKNQRELEDLHRRSGKFGR